MKLNTADKQFVYVANGSQVQILGSVFFDLRVGNQMLSEKFLIADAIDEPILGLQFLQKNRCTWSFEFCTLTVNGELVKLKQRPGTSEVRRIYVRESVCVPANTTSNIPVRLPFSNFYAPAAEWLTESKALRPGLFLARTLLPNDDRFAAVFAVNVSGKDQFLRSDLCLGKAEPGVCLSAGVSTEISAGNDITNASRICTITTDSGNSSNYSQSATTAGDVTGAHSAAADVVTDLIDRETPGCPADSIHGSEHIDGAVDFSGMSDAELYSQFDVAFDYLKPSFDSLPEDLNSSERRKVAELLLRYADVFSSSEFDIGFTDVLHQTIDTGNHSPIAEPLRRHPRVHLDLIDESVDKLLNAGVIEPSASPWSFNIVLVKKKDSQTPRVTVDYRRLNEITVKDKFPLPRAKDCLDALSGSTFFSTLDLSQSFYAIPLDPRDRDKTAFATRRGQYRFCRCPMGISNSPGLFARLMTLVLHGLTYFCCLVFIDDTIVLGRDFDDHLLNVETVMQRFRQSGLKLKPGKCKFFQKRVKFLGHVVSQDGVGVDPLKVSCIREWPFPRNITELRGFLGLTSYYRAFCPGYAKVAEPLAEMLRKNEKIVPTERRIKAFNDLKDFLTSPPLLPCLTTQARMLLTVTPAPLVWGPSVSSGRTEG